MPSSKNNIVSTIRPWAENSCARANVELWNIEYIKEGGEYYLRVYIDKEGGVNITDCENVSHILGDILDLEDPIEESYIFQVASPGIERELKTPAHFAAFIGEMIKVRLYKAFEGSKTYIGKLLSHDEKGLTIEFEGREITFPAELVARVNVYYEFN